MKKNTLFLIAFLLHATPAAAFSVSHDFNVFLGPFNASNTKFDYSLQPDKYKVQSNVSTLGLFNALYPFEAQYTTTGRVNKKDLETTSYISVSKSRFNKRRKEMIYDENGLPIYRISSKNAENKKEVEILPSPDNKGTTDLQTVLAELAYQYNETKFCASRMQVFDGKHRFDVIFRDEGQEQLISDEFLPFSGTASKCAMYVDKLKETGDDLLWDFDENHPIYFWILTDEKTNIPFIAKIETNSTPLGKLKAYTYNLTIQEK